MEIVLAVLLFFGGFTLGSITADKGDEESQSTMAMPKVDSAADSPPVIQAMRHSDPIRCHSEGTVVYRDLTVPYQGKMGEPTRQVGDSHNGGDSPDE